MDTFEELIKTLNDETASSYYRRNAISSLGRLKNERAVEHLVSVLRDEDRYIRSEAAKVLGEMGFASAVEPLIGILKDADDQVRRAAIVALGTLGDERAIEPLRGALKDQSYFTRSEAEKSIKQIEGRLKEPVIAEETKPEPKPEPPTPPAELEIAAPVPPKQEEAVVVKEEPEISSPPPTTAATASAKKPPEAAKIADEVNQQQETESQSSSVFFDMLDGLVSVEKKSRRKPAIIAIIAVFIVMNVITKGAILPLAMIFLPIGFITWIKFRRKKQGASAKTMDLLLKGLRNNDPAIRAISAKILGESGDKRAIRPLWEAAEVEQDAATKDIMEKALIRLGK